MTLFVPLILIDAVAKQSNLEHVRIDHSFGDHESKEAINLLTIGEVIDFHREMGLKEGEVGLAKRR